MQTQAQRLPISNMSYQPISNNEIIQKHSTIEDDVIYHISMSTNIQRSNDQPTRKLQEVTASNYRPLGQCC